MIRGRRLSRQFLLQNPGFSVSSCQITFPRIQVGLNNQHSTFIYCYEGNLICFSFFFKVEKVIKSWCKIIHTPSRQTVNSGLRSCYNIQTTGGEISLVLVGGGAEIFILLF